MNPVLLGVDGLFCFTQFVVGIISILDDASIGWIICIIIYLIVAASTLAATRKGEQALLVGHGLLLVMTIVIMCWDIHAALSWIAFVWMLLVGLVQFCPLVCKAGGGSIDSYTHV